MDMKEILEKCILTEEEMNIFQEKLNSIHGNKTFDTHGRDFRTMMNPTRRAIIKTIGYGAMSTEDLMKALELEKDQLMYHLSMVEQTVYIMNTQEGWKLTPRGIGFLNNTSIEF